MLRSVPSFCAQSSYPWPFPWVLILYIFLSSVWSLCIYYFFHFFYILDEINFSYLLLTIWISFAKWLCLLHIFLCWISLFLLICWIFKISGYEFRVSYIYVKISLPICLFSFLMVSFDEQSFSIFMWPYSLNSSLVLSLACLRNPPLPECLSWELRGMASEKEMCMQTAYCRVLSGTRPVREWEGACVQWGDLNCDATARQSHRALWNGKDATELCWVEVRRSGFYTLRHPQREPDVDN